MEENSNSSSSRQVSISDAIASASPDASSSANSVITHPDALNSLPNEILSQIRLWLYTMENPWKNARCKRNVCGTRKNKTFALVCRRFRAVELSTPLLWTTVRDQMPLKDVKLNVERSGGCGLFVRLFVNAGTNKFKKRPGPWCRCEKWSLIAAEAERWEGLEVILHGKNALYMYRHEEGHEDDHTGAPTSINTCFSMFRGLVLPRLRWLVVKIDDSKAVNIVKSWTLPRLDDFRCEPPGILFGLRLSHPLKALYLNMTPIGLSPFPWIGILLRPYVANASGADDLLELLASPVGSGLQSLRLILGGYSLREPRTDNPIHPNLPSLKFLEIYFSHATEVSAPIDWLFERMLAPALKTVVIKFTVANTSPDMLIRWLELLDYRVVEVVKCRIMCSWEEDEKEVYRERLVEAAMGSFERSAASELLLDIRFMSCLSSQFW